MSKEKNIVVLGAGYGGILTAKKMARKFKKDENIRITLIDKNSYHTMLTELHEVAAGRVPEEAIRIDLEKVFAGRKVDIVLDEISNIDFNAKKLQGKVKDYTYDYLVLGTGSKPTFYNCDGAKEHALTLWSYEDAIRIKSHIIEIMGEASVETDPVRRRNLLTFMVIGSGFTGIEMVGELAEWKTSLCHRFSIDPEEVKIYVVDMVPKVLPTFKDKLINKTVKRLHKLGVEVLTSSNITEVKENFVTIEGKGTIETHTVIWAAGVEGSDLMGSLDDIEKVGRNRVQTDQYLRAKGQEDVFVVGDNIFYIPEGEDRPVPQMVENAEHSASTVAHNIEASVKKTELKEYKPAFHGAMVCIGGRYGVAQVGTDKTEFCFSGFIAMFIKHFINMIYFIQVAGFNKVWTYLMHEIFHVEDRRSFVGGYFAKRSPNFWLVPLRMFLGFKWLMEGLAKIGQVIKDPTDIFLIPAAPVADATAAASEWVEEGAEAVTALPVPEFITNMVDWSMDLMFYTPDGGYTALASIFQTGMVIGEIIVGLCLLGGLFSALASIVSIAMGMMIWASGMAPNEMLWYMIAGVATIGGSGSTFGLDYYVLPFLKKQWKRIGFVKKWYLFTD
ncbi:NAD(P)/FAD-dependent oxidoreductase [Vallitaleaceae bacterium 9-2]